MCTTKWMNIKQIQATKSQPTPSSSYWRKKPLSGDYLSIPRTRRSKMFFVQYGSSAKSRFSASLINEKINYLQLSQIACINYCFSSAWNLLLNTLIEFTGLFILSFFYRKFFRASFFRLFLLFPSGFVATSMLICSPSLKTQNRLMVLNHSQIPILIV